MTPDGAKVPLPERVKRLLPEHLEPGSLSVVVFGPGRGEAIAVVLPDGSVGIVDGCREPGSSRSGRGDPVRDFLAALEQHRTRSRQPFRFRFVCLTHPHDDHYAGLGRLLNAYRGKVEAVWSVPKVGDRFAEALQRYVAATRAGRDPMPDDVDQGGLERVLAELREAPQHGSAFKHVEQGKLLLEEPVQGHSLRILACGPADLDLHNAQLALVEGLEHLITHGEHETRFDPNATSGALIIRWGQAGVLLGGDLLCEQGRYCGWKLAAPDIHSPIQVVKAAHHASAEAHHADLWARLKPLLAIVTPFKNATGSMPPRPEQIDRLAHDAVVAITATPSWTEDMATPRPVYSAASSAKRRRGGLRSKRNDVIPLTPSPGANDTHNAVAVSLDASGNLLRFVLAGKADVYETASSIKAAS